MVVFAVAGFALRLRRLLPLLAVASVCPLRHQVRHFEHHRSIVRRFVLPPTAFALAHVRLRVLVVVQLGVVEGMVVVVLLVGLRYRLQL